MKALLEIRRLLVNASERTEFWIVLFVAFGPAISSSLAAGLLHLQLVRTGHPALVNMTFQLGVLGFVLWISGIRGWSFRQLGLHTNLRLTAIGILLFLVTTLVLIIFSAVMRLFAPSSSDSHVGAVGLSCAAILAISFVNALFEETLVCGYIIQRLAERSATLAIVFSAFVRLLYHTDKGLVSIGALLIGLMFGCLFWRYRELWPLIVAHGLMDLIGLLRHFGKI